MRFSVPIAVVGMGGVFPQAQVLEQFWDVIAHSVDTSAEVSSERWIMEPAQAYVPYTTPDRTRSLRACLIDAFSCDPEGLDLPRGLLDDLDPLYHVTLHAGRQAYRAAQMGDVDPTRVGTVLAAIALPTDRSSQLGREVLGRALLDRLDDPQVTHIPGFGESRNLLSRWQALNSRVTGLPASLLSMALGLGGGSYTLDAACASSLYAIKLACDALQDGRADAMLAGGVSRPENLYNQIGFTQLHALSKRGRCSPFDAAADGLVVGEGAGILALKRLPDAVVAGDQILGVIHGVGLSNDIGGNLLAPDCEGQVRAMKTAYQQADWNPSSVDLIECHGTGTPLGDMQELRSLHTLWEGQPLVERHQRCVLGSVKSNVGHLLTAAAAASTIKILLAFQHQSLPPSANFEEPVADSPLAQETSPFEVGHSVQAWGRPEAHPRRAAVSAFGFGGINAHLLLEEWEPDSTKAAQIAAAPIEAWTRTKQVEASGEITLSSDVEPIAIVGMQVQVGSAKGLRAFQESCLRGESLLQPRPESRWWDAESHVQDLIGRRCAKGAYIDDLDVPIGRYRLPPNEIPQLLPQQLLMLDVAAGALVDAGMPLREERPEMGAFIGVGFDFETTHFHLRWALERQVRAWAKSKGLAPEHPQLLAWLEQLQAAMGPALNTTRTIGALGGLVASRIAKEFLFGGPSFIVSAEEGSGMQSLDIAARALRRGELDAALVGAIDMVGDIRHLLATHTWQPFARDDQSLPFDREAMGSAIGEGAVALVLKRASDARADGDRVYALLRGFGASAGGGLEPAVPTRAAMKRAMALAYHEAGVDPSSISYLDAHGSGDPVQDRAEIQALTDFFGAQRPTPETDEAYTTVVAKDPVALGSAKAIAGYTGATSGLLSVLKTSLCLYQELLPPLPGLTTPVSPKLWGSGLFHVPKASQFWVRDRCEGPRRAAVQSLSFDGNVCHWVMEAAETVIATQDSPSDASPSDTSLSNTSLSNTNFSGARVEHARLAWERHQPLGATQAGLFVLEADDVSALLVKLGEVRQFMASFAGGMQDAAQTWWAKHPLDVAQALAVTIVATSHEQAFAEIDFLTQALTQRPGERYQTLSGSRFNPRPVGREGKLAFVYPGSGNHYVGMGRGLGVRWPHVLRQMDAATDRLRTQLLPECYMPWRHDWSQGWQQEAAAHIASDAHHMIYGQVVHGGVVTEVMKQFGLAPNAVIGYSLGESAGLFASGAWPERGVMLERMLQSQLFRTELAGPCDVARQVWDVPEGEEVSWRTAFLRHPADVVRAHPFLQQSTARLLIVNTPNECVVGGRAADVEALVQDLQAKAIDLEGIVTVHCEVVEPVAQAYRDLHIFPTSPPEGVRYYSGYWGRSYELTQDNAADSILLQALHGFDYTKTIRQAYEDGVRLFVEMGPQASCSRMIAKILADKDDVLAQSACVRAEDDVLTIVKLLSALCSERVDVRLDALFGPVDTEGVLLERPDAREQAAGAMNPVGLLPDEALAQSQRSIQVKVGGTMPTPPPLPVGLQALLDGSKKAEAEQLRRLHKSTLTPPTQTPPQPRSTQAPAPSSRVPQASVSTSSATPKPTSSEKPEPAKKPTLPHLAPEIYSNGSAQPRRYKQQAQPTTNGHVVNGAVSGAAGAVSTPVVPVVTPSTIYPGAHVVQQPQTKPLSSVSGHVPHLSPSPLSVNPVPGMVAMSDSSTSAGSPQPPVVSSSELSSQAALVQGAQQLSVGLLPSMVAAQQAKVQSHEQYTAFVEESNQGIAEAFAYQNFLLSAMMQQPQLAGVNPALPQSTQPQPTDPRADVLSTQAGVPVLPQGWLTPTAPPAHIAQTPQLPVVQAPTQPVAFDREMCMEFAIGSLATVLGPEFAAVDSYPVRVRLPDEPLMLVDRILTVDAVKGSMTSGSLVTEHDVHPGMWYLDSDRMPVCVTVEAGQADLFLCSYLGIDLQVKGKRAYRLLDAEIHFHRGLPRSGDVIQYDITIDKFMRQGEVYLFFFRFEGTINGEPLLTMENGCAGFFTPEEVQNSGGIVLTKEDTEPQPGVVKGWRPLVPFEKSEAYDEAAVQALRRGDLVAAYGETFAGLPLQAPTRLPQGKMELFHRVLEASPTGGRFGLGSIRSEADIRPDDWFLTCHFMDDMVMPGTLMYECCAHTLRVLLMRMGWVGEHVEVAYEPVPMVKSRLRCRGPVTVDTKKVVYEVEIQEIGYNPEPYVIAEALIYGDGERIVSFRGMSMRLTGSSQTALEGLWQGRGQMPAAALAALPTTSQAAGTPLSLPILGDLVVPPPSSEILFDSDRIMAYCIGKPSEAFGEPYTIYDEGRVIARLPGPPYLFVDRVTALDHEAWALKAGGWIEVEYDVPPDAWYFRANRDGVMPFCVLLEAALQPCGWLAAYAGSALHGGDKDLSFRNLGGKAIQHQLVWPDAGTLRIRVRMTEVSKAGGMIIERFDMLVLRGQEPVYEGNTYFGFFSKQALEDQVGIIGAEKREFQPTAEDLALSEAQAFPVLAPLTPDDPEMDPDAAPDAYPGRALLMLDDITVCMTEGGPHGLGFVRGTKQTDASAWFFKAHFYQDPVWPGSLGLESFLQLIKHYAVKRWGADFMRTHRCEPVALHHPHEWVYRGQILPNPTTVEVDAVITALEEGESPMIRAHGFVKNNGLFIYEMLDFGVRWVPRS